MSGRLSPFQREFDALEEIVPARISGRITRVVGLIAESHGLAAPVGAQCEIVGRGGHRLPAEVVGFREEYTIVVPYGDIRGVAAGDRIFYCEDAPRVQVSLTVRLEVELPYGHSIRICQSENISESGMLVRTEDTVPIGTLGLVSFQLPNVERPTEARVRVVRETVAGEIPGIALHFEEFQEGGEASLVTYLAGKASA